MKTNGTLTKASGLLLSFAAGASLMYLLDPLTGRRRRAEVTQKMRRLGNVAKDVVEGKARHVRNRAQGLVAEMTAEKAAVESRRRKGPKSARRRRR